VVAVTSATTAASGSQREGQSVDSLRKQLDLQVQALAPGWALQPEVYPAGHGEKLCKWALSPADDKISIWVIEYPGAADADARLRGIRLSVGEHWVTGIGDAAFVGFVNRRGPASLYLRVDSTYAQIFVPAAATSPDSAAVDLALRLGQGVARIMGKR